MVILIAVSLVLGDDQCAHHSTGTSITSQGQGDCLLHEPQTSWQCSSSSWSYDSLCWAKFSCDSHEKNRILQDVVSFNNCPRNHQFPNAKELKALSFRHTLLVQCWPFLNGRCCCVFLLMRGTTFYTSQKDHIADQEQEQSNILCIISSHSIEFLWSAYHTTDEFTCSKTWQDKNLLPSFQAESWHQWSPWCIQSQNHHMPKGHEHVHHPMGWSTPVLQVGLLFWWKKKTKGGPTVASRVCLSTLLLIISCDNESSKQIVLDPKRCGSC